MKFSNEHYQSQGIAAARYIAASVYIFNQIIIADPLLPYLVKAPIPLLFRMQLTPTIPRLHHLLPSAFGCQSTQPAWRGAREVPTRRHLKGVALLIDDAVGRTPCICRSWS